MERTTTRKSRFKATNRGIGRHGERVSGTRNQLAVLESLLTGPKPSTYLYAWIGTGSAVDVVHLMHDNDFIGISEEANYHPQKNNRPNIYELRPKGIKLALDNGLITHDYATTHQFRHGLLASAIQFSFDIAPREVPGLRKIDIWEILTRNSSKAVYRDAMKGKNPSHIPLGGKEFIIPDAPLFGYEYGEGVRKRYFYLHGFEADRQSEPIRGADRQTIEFKVRQYTRYLRSGGFKTRYGISNVTIPIVTLHKDPERKIRLQNIRDIIDEVAGEYASRFIVTSLPDFIRLERFPAATGYLVTETQWLGAKGREFNILDFLKGEANGRTDRQPTTSAHYAA